MKREDEELSRIKFDNYLKRLLPVNNIEWQEVKQRDEPPDYYLFLSGEKYAVEVTSLMENIDWGYLNLPITAIRSFLSNFAKEVEKDAKEGGFLNGSYNVFFKKPIKDFRNTKDNIKQGILDYVRKTKGLDTSPESVIFINGTDQEFNIEKISIASNHIHMPAPVRAKWEGEIEDQLCDLIQERLSEKTDKLRHISSPKIILLLDRYVFADNSMYIKCIPELRFGDFYAVFIVQGSAGFLIHTKNPKWLFENNKLTGLL